MNSRRTLFALIGAGFLLGLCLAGYALAQDNSQTEAPKIIRKPAGVLEGSAINRVGPVYPPLAKAARVPGSVVVEVTIDEDGNVAAAQAVSGHPLLKDSAVAAARGWKFSPTELSGRRVKVIGTLTFNFRLPDDTQKPSNSDDNDIEDAKKAIKANAYSPEAHFKLAEAYVEEGIYEKAIDSYKRAIELKATYREAYLGLASVYKRQGNRDEEINIYR